MREFALLAAILALGACAMLHKQAPASPVTQPPAKSTGNDPIAPPPRVTAADQRAYEQDKNRAKLALAISNRNSLAPTDVGYYMDVLQGRLKQIGGSGTSIIRQGDRIVFDFPSRLGFDSDSSQFNPAIRELLMPLSKVLVEYRMTVVLVQVRAHDSDTPAISARLAEQRARAVANYLIETGVASKRIVISGPGANPTGATNANPGNSTHVELQFEPIVRTVDSRR